MHFNGDHSGVWFEYEPQTVSDDRKERHRQLCSSILRNEEPWCFQLLTAGVNCNAKGYLHRTPLMFACFKHRPNILNRILQEPYLDVNIQDKKGYTALHLAVQTHNIVAVTVLLARDDIDINALNKKDETPLLIACKKGVREMVDLLIAHGADIEMAENELGYTPLLTSVLNHVDVVDTLLNAGAYVNATDYKNVTPLIQACCRGRLDVVERLFQCDELDVDILDDHRDMSAFELAVWKGQTDIVKAFMDRGRCPNLLSSRYLQEENANGRVRSFWTIAERQGNIKLMDYLFEAVKIQLIAVLSSFETQPRMHTNMVSLVAEFSV